MEDGLLALTLDAVGPTADRQGCNDHRIPREHWKGECSLQTVHQDGPEGRIHG